MIVRTHRLLAGIAAMAGWLPACTAGFVDAPVRYGFPAASAQAVSIADPMKPARAEGRARTKGRCAECGLIASVREIAGNDGDFHRTATGGMTAGRQVEAMEKASRRYEITIRMTDGSSRVISHDSPASWRPGERVILIAGASRPPARKVQSWAR